MDPRQLFIDDRLTRGCVFCGGMPSTRDHAPSRVFLDEPLPDDLPVVEACAKCNHAFSLDEEYLACFLEAVLAGTADPEKLNRARIKRALSRNSQLVSRIEASAQIDDGIVIWKPEITRVQNVVLKLARGHAAHELGLSQIDEPIAVTFQPFLSMTEQDRMAFENAREGELRGWPEIGSRAYLRASGLGAFSDSASPWIEIQPMRYRYAVDQSGGVLVRMVLSEYLACQVEWD